MTAHISCLRRSAVAILILQLAACGGADPSDEPFPAEDIESALDADALPGADASAANDLEAMAAAPVEAQFSLSVADLESYTRGLQREIELMQSARERLAQAQDQEEQLDILGEILPQNLRREGAAAASISEDRYRRIVDSMNDVLGKLDMRESSQQMIPSEEELAQLPPEVRAQIEEGVREMQETVGDPFAGLAPATGAAIQAALAELRALRAEHLGLLLSAGR